MKKVICMGAIALMLAAVPGFAAQVRPSFMVEEAGKMPETVGTPRDVAAHAAQMQELQQRLAASQVEKALKQPVVIELTSSERNRIDDRDRVEQQKYLVGVTRPVGSSVALSASGNLDLGAVSTTEDGFVWTAAFRVPGATALRLHLTGVDLPAGTSLYVYNLAGHAFGPYTGRGPLGDGVLHTNTVFGEQLLLQVHSQDADRAPRLTVEAVGVMGARFAIPRYNDQGVFDVNDLNALTANASNLCSRNAECIVNAACQSTTPVNDAKDAVASILFLSGSSYYICTGGLIADTDTATIVPLFLTANHCISASGEASSVETYFDYVTTCSNPDCTQPYNNTGETVGSTLLAGSSKTDVTLLQLSAAPTTPDGVATYLGYSTTAVANTNGAGLYRISHPAGSPQAYSEGVVDTNKGTCRTLPRGDFIYSTDVVGGTEGGSSGSPVVNSSGQIVGQLYGACGFNVNDPCDAASNATVDGAFAVSYATLEPFLTGGSGGGGGCTLLPSGSSCTSNSECCSNSCKGKPGAKTCK